MGGVLLAHLKANIVNVGSKGLGARMYNYTKKSNKQASTSFLEVEPSAHTLNACSKLRQVKREGGMVKLCRLCCLMWFYEPTVIDGVKIPCVIHIAIQALFTAWCELHDQIAIQSAYMNPDWFNSDWDSG